MYDAEKVEFKFSRLRRPLKQLSDELLEFLCQRSHEKDYVKTKINKAFNVPREDTLYCQHKKCSNHTIFVTT